MGKQAQKPAKLKAGKSTGGIGFYRLMRPFLFLIPPEKAHELTIRCLKKSLGPRHKNNTFPALRTKVCGLDFPNPVGLAAGFDKQGEVVGELFGFGFGFAEIGSITPQPQPGNPRPRLFRIPEAEAVINRLGFNSEGFDACLRHITAHYDASVKKRPGVVGINIGKNKTSPDAGADYAEGVARFAPYADYLTVNISLPNTPGLRDLQGREQLTALLRTVMEARAKAQRQPPLFVKIAPTSMRPRPRISRKWRWLPGSTA